MQGLGHAGMSELVQQKHEVVLALAAPPLQSAHEPAAEHSAPGQIIASQLWNKREEVELRQDLFERAHVSD